MSGQNIRQQGITLIEILITMLVVSIGLLSVAAMQIKASQYSQASFQRSLAIVQASDLVERLWAGVCDLPGNQANIAGGWITDHSAWISNDWDGLTVNLENGIYEVVITIQLDNKNEENDLPEFVHATTLPAISCS